MDRFHQYGIIFFNMHHVLLIKRKTHLNVRKNQNLYAGNKI